MYVPEQGSRILPPMSSLQLLQKEDWNKHTYLLVD